MSEIVDDTDMNVDALSNILYKFAKECLGNQTQAAVPVIEMGETAKEL